MMDVVTPEAIDHIIRAGPLAGAYARALDGTARPRNKAQWEKVSSWELICEEILDTEHSSEWYDDILAELGRRGFNREQIDRMRRFAWETAGWLNYNKMLWEWVALDENDIRRALDWQLDEGIIDRACYHKGLEFLERPADVSAVT